MTKQIPVVVQVEREVDLALLRSKRLRQSILRQAFSGRMVGTLIKRKSKNNKKEVANAY